MKNETIEILNNIKIKLIDVLSNRNNVDGYDKIKIEKLNYYVEMFNSLDDYVLYIDIFDDNINNEIVYDIFSEFKYYNIQFVKIDEYTKIILTFPSDVNFKLLNRKRKLKLLENERIIEEIFIGKIYT